MRSDLDHLPASVRGELRSLERILFAEFEDALAGRNASHRKAGRILKIILFGSYARGDWVADPIGGYFSDFDILVVVNHDELADITEYWSIAEDHLLRNAEAQGPDSVPVNLIVHSLSDMNRQLKRGRPFFVNIVRDGIALYEAAGHPFDPPKAISAAAAAAEARSYFDEWFPSAVNFLTLASHAAASDMRKEAAFLIHQAAERLYHCTSLVFTLYSTKSHKLNFLRSQAERLSPALIEAWPRDTRAAQRCFELLRRAYVDARYSPHYKITADELNWLIARVGVLQNLVEQVCLARLTGQDVTPLE